jgi:23S rRNA pseudouridine1911/1915/1917 synthase
VPEFRVVVPELGTTGRPQPVWRVGSVLKFCLGLSRVERAKIWTRGGAKVNGAPVIAGYMHCFPGNVVEAWYPEEHSAVSPERETALSIMYEDEWLPAVNKPAGQLSHPARGEQSGTVANAVAARYPAPSGAAPAPVRPVHRLDRDTSGILLFAREARTAALRARHRTSGAVRRDYLALVAGHPTPSGNITYALGPEPAHRTRRVALVPREDGTDGVVRFLAAEVAELPARNGFGTAAENGITRDLAPQGVAFQDARTSYSVVQYGDRGALVAARLHTGRTHQLRAHMAALGHPLIADNLYGGPPSSEIGRQALHAWRMRFRHPITGADITLSAPLPDDFQRAARTL